MEQALLRALAEVMHSAMTLLVACGINVKIDRSFSVGVLNV